MIAATLEFIKTDYTSHPVRHVAEVIGMLIGLAVAVVIAVTTPAPPLLGCYILWNVASVLLLCASYSRGSFGLMALYGGFLIIDSVGLIRTLMV